MNYTPRRLGYARISTCEQTLDLQLNALNSARCDKIFTDRGISATAKSRPGFEDVLEALRPHDSLVLWRLDRAFRSLRHAMDILDHFEKHQIDFVVIMEGIDTSTPMGRCFYQIQNAFAELEKNLISERTKAGLQAAKKRGVKLGRPPALNPKQIVTVRRLITDGIHKNIIAKQFGVSSRTVHRAV